MKKKLKKPMLFGHSRRHTDIVKTVTVKGTEYVLPTMTSRNISRMDELLENLEDFQNSKKAKAVLKKARMLNTKMLMRELKRMGVI